MTQDTQTDIGTEVTIDGSGRPEPTDWLDSVEVLLANPTR